MNLHMAFTRLSHNSLLRDIVLKMNYVTKLCDTKFCAMEYSPRKSFQFDHFSNMLQWMLWLLYASCFAFGLIVPYIFK